MLQAAKEKDHFLAALQRFAAVRAGQDPAWLARLREEAQARFEELDFPTTRHEEWKYTNVAPILKIPYRHAGELEAPAVAPEAVARFSFAESRRSQIVFVNGRFAPALSDLSAFPAGVVVSNLSAVADGDHWVRDHLGAYADFRGDAFTALNTALVGDGAFVHVLAGKVVETPIHLLFVATRDEANVAAQLRTLLVADRGAMATVVESYVTLADEVYWTNAVTEVVLAEGASLDHYRLQEESERAFHVGTTEVQQERESRYASCAVSLGAALSRHNLNVALADERIECAIDGLYVVTGSQHVDNHTSLDHQRPHGESHQLYKGILDGRARAVFNGKIVVREGALLTDARQLNKNLLLSPEAQVSTKPQLEIFADDVKCAHGATVGQLEDEEVFYLASRGLTPERARALLTYGFAEDVIGKIRLASVRRYLDQTVLDRLHQSLEVR